MIPKNVDGIMTREGLELQRVLRDGPRYWVGRVSRDGEMLLLKVVTSDEPWLSPASRRQFRPSDQLRAEIFALRQLGEHEGQLAGRVPRVLASSTNELVWALREEVPGTDMAGTAGSYVFAPEFYEQVSPAEMIDYIASYQALTPELEALARTTPQTDQTDLVSKLVIGDLDNPQEHLQPLSEKVNKFLREHGDFHDAQIATLAHGEVYPPHIFYADGQVCLIDWENVSLSHPLSDYCAVWLRSYDNKAWQGQYLSGLERRGILGGPERQKLWNIEVVYQSAKNLNYLYWSQIEPPEIKRAAVAALRRNIENVLS
jgi:aminoglycoside phosphotransferase (APT) family kinase protein